MLETEGVHKCALSQSHVVHSTSFMYNRSVDFWNSAEVAELV